MPRKIVLKRDSSQPGWVGVFLKYTILWMIGFDCFVDTHHGDQNSIETADASVAHWRGLVKTLVEQPFLSCHLRAPAFFAQSRWPNCSHLQREDD
jgi:hypothetical protein